MRIKNEFGYTVELKKGDKVRPVSDHRALDSKQVYLVISLERDNDWNDPSDWMICVQDRYGKITGGWYLTRFIKVHEIWDCYETVE